jgi:dTDP-4-dehydro-6-deoxy-alpha-D-glucopyranose 2,3-dehydratase
MNEINIFNTTDEIISWIKQRNNEVKVKVDRINFSDTNQWIHNEEKGVIHHISNKYFSIEGINVSTNFGDVTNWDQPIINQSEIGLLGIITREINGVLYYLMQAKIEPGNVNNVQISPTLQATESNFTRVHKGKTPLYLEYFLDRKKSIILFDNLQSEQGSRFLRKRNRNIIIQVFDEIPVDENFRWITLNQIKELMKLDNTINMDTRTVISHIPIMKLKTLSFTSIQNDYSSGNNHNSINSIDEVNARLIDLKFKYKINIRKKKLNNLTDWIFNKNEIFKNDESYFKVIFANIEIQNREVSGWNQPLIKSCFEGLYGFIVKLINGKYHFLIQLVLECGNSDGFELGPTVQCLDFNYCESKTPFLNYFMSCIQENVIYDTLQSEEGGRFYHDQNRNMIIKVNETEINELPENYIWMTYEQILLFIKFNNYVNIQARSLIASLINLEF